VSSTSSAVQTFDTPFAVHVGQGSDEGLPGSALAKKRGMRRFAPQSEQGSCAEFDAPMRAAQALQSFDEFSLPLLSRAHDVGARV
jgi:hypothetical protein